MTHSQGHKSRLTVSLRWPPPPPSNFWCHVQVHIEPGRGCWIWLTRWRASFVYISLSSKDCKAGLDVGGLWEGRGGPLYLYLLYCVLYVWCLRWPALSWLLGRGAPFLSYSGRRLTSSDSLTSTLTNESIISELWLEVPQGRSCISLKFSKFIFWGIARNISRFLFKQSSTS